MVLNSLNLCLSGKLFISPSILSEILARYSNLSCRFFTLNISCHSFLVFRVSAERSAVKHMEFPMYVICCFSLAAFSILYMCLIFVSLISICLRVFLLGFILYGTLCASWTWLTISFSVHWKYSALPFWPTEFLLKDQLLNIWSFPCMLLVAFPLLLLISFLCV